MCKRASIAICVNLPPRNLKIIIVPILRRSVFIHVCIHGGDRDFASAVTTRAPCCTLRAGGTGTAQIQAAMRWVHWKSVDEMGLREKMWARWLPCTTNLHSRSGKAEFSSRWFDVSQCWVENWTRTLTQWLKTRMAESVKCVCTQARENTHTQCQASKQLSPKHAQGHRRKHTLTYTRSVSEPVHASASGIKSPEQPGTNRHARKKEQKRHVLVDLILKMYAVW